jgi:hypothetical protein
LSAWSDYSYDDGSDHHNVQDETGARPVLAVVICVIARDGSGLLSAVITEAVMFWLIAPPGRITRRNRAHAGRR